MALTPATRARLQATLACAGAAFAWWRFGGIWPVALFAVLGLFALLAWASPRHYAPIQRGLDRVVNGFLAVVTWVVLGAVYFGLFTPWRLWRTLTKNDPLDRRRDPTAASYLRPLPPAATGRYDRQF